MNFFFSMPAESRPYDFSFLRTFAPLRWMSNLKTLLFTDFCLGTGQQASNIVAMSPE